MSFEPVKAGIWGATLSIAAVSIASCGGDDSGRGGDLAYDSGTDGGSDGGPDGGSGPCSWEVVHTVPDGGLHGVWGSSSDDVFVVGQDGQVWHWDGCGWTQMDSPTDVDLESVFGFAGGDVWAVGHMFHGAMIRFDGSAWTEVHADVMYDIYPRRVWGPSPDEIYVTAGEVWRCDGAGCVALPAGPCPAGDDLWGWSSSDIYFTSVFEVARYDGSSWDCLDVGNQVAELLKPLTAIGGAGPDEVYVASAYGDYDECEPGPWADFALVLRYDGSGWTQISDGGPLFECRWFHSIYAASATAVFVDGRLYYDGSGWTEMPLPDGVSAITGDVWGFGADDLFAVSGNKVLRCTAD